MFTASHAFGTPLSKKPVHNRSLRGPLFLQRKERNLARMKATVELRKMAIEMNLDTGYHMDLSPDEFHTPVVELFLYHMRKASGFEVNRTKYVAANQIRQMVYILGTINQYQDPAAKGRDGRYTLDKIEQCYPALGYIENPCFLPDIYGFDDVTKRFDIIRQPKDDWEIVVRGVKVNHEFKWEYEDYSTFSIKMYEVIKHIERTTGETISIHQLTVDLAKIARFQIGQMHICDPKQRWRCQCLDKQRTLWNRQFPVCAKILREVSTEGFADKWKYLNEVLPEDELKPVIEIRKCKSQERMDRKPSWGSKTTSPSQVEEDKHDDFARKYENRNKSILGEFGNMTSGFYEAKAHVVFPTMDEP